jgi:RHS repeat-associated protein
MTAGDTLEVSGTAPSSTAIDICTGWNLIAYPLSQPYAVPGVLSSIDGDYTRVFGYEAVDGADPWEVFDVAVPEWAKDLQTMGPGRGYWVLATADGTLVVEPAPAPPVVAITSPADAAETTTLTDVTGSVGSPALSGWVLERRLASDDSWVAFASGSSPVSDAFLGTFDPTLLLNGIHKIRLSATDLFGQSASAWINLILEGDLKIGHFTISLLDLQVPVSGLPIQVIRTYDSRDKRSGDFGAGWTLQISDVRLEETGLVGRGWTTVQVGLFNVCIVPVRPHVITVALSNGTLYEFQPVLTPECAFGAAPDFVDITFEPLPGTHATLTSLEGTGAFVVPAPSGGVELVGFFSGSVFDANLYRLTTREGQTLRIDQGSGLQSLTDLNGNSLTVSAAGLVHSSGKGISFLRDGAGRITRITDPLGNTLDYAYDASGDLIGVNDRLGNLTQYIYNDRHDLLEIIDPTGISVTRNEYAPDNRLIASIDADGNRFDFVHDLGLQREITRDRLGNETILDYDDRGNVLSRTDALGNTTTFTYDARDNELSRTDPLGRTLTRSFDSFDNVLSEVDEDGNLTTFTYNGRNQLLTRADARGRVTTNTYDVYGNLIQATDGEGAVTQYTVDVDGNTLSTTDPLGNVTAFTYDSFGNQTSRTDSLGNVTAFTYDAANQTVAEARSRTLPDGSSETITLQYEYDAAGALVRTVDGLGNSVVVENNARGKPQAITDKNGGVTLYEYDSRGYPTTITSPSGATEAYTYDAEGRMLTQTDREGNTTSFEYDDLGRKVRTTWPDGSSTATTYDAIGRVTSQTDELGNVTSFSYGLNRETITDALGGVTVRELDSDGNLIRLTDANGNVTSYAYDKGSEFHGEGRLIETSFADGTRIQQAYDDAGRLTTRTDQAGRTTQFGYDSEGRLVSVTDALGNVTTYGYDELGARTSITDANGRTTRFEYDSVGRLTGRLLFLGQEESFTYDANGNVVSHTDFNGDTTTFTYDSADRLVLKTFPDGSTESYFYTPGGQRQEAGGDSYTYDSRGRLLSETKASGEILTYAYDAASNRTSLTTPVGTTGYTYDALNRLATVVDPDGGVTSYAYDAVGNLQTVTLPNGLVTTHGYDALNRPISVETRDAATTILTSYAQILGPAGHVLQVLEGHSGRVVDYAYDAAYRLTTETIGDPLEGTRMISYAYDAVGNRLTRSDSLAGSTTYTYDDNDRLVTETTPGGTITHGYDDNGNLTSRTGPGLAISNAWDFQNRLIRTNDGAALVEYSYDVDGNRTGKTVNVFDVANFLVDKNRTLPQVLLETDGAGAPTASYVYGRDLLSQKRPGSGTAYYLYDGQSSVRHLADPSGSLTDQYTYDAFGELLSSTGTTPNNYRYRGEQLDPDLDAYYLRARYYRPGIGRFMSMDPFRGFDRDPTSLHKYLYAHNDPINNFDPSGLLSIRRILDSLFGGGRSLGSTSGFSSQQIVTTGLAFRSAELAILRMRGETIDNSYVRWFGSRDSSRVTQVHGTWLFLRTALIVPRPIEFEVRDECPSGVLAFVASTFGRSVTLCPSFFESDEKVVTIIHELTHALIGLRDQRSVVCGVSADPDAPGAGEGDRLFNRCYGVWAAQRLARLVPSKAVRNPDNYSYQAVCAGTDFSSPECPPVTVTIGEAVIETP